MCWRSCCRENRPRWYREGKREKGPYRHVERSSTILSVLQARCVSLYRELRLKRVQVYLSRISLASFSSILFYPRFFLGFLSVYTRLYIDSHWPNEKVKKFQRRENKQKRRNLILSFWVKKRRRSKFGPFF